MIRENSTRRGQLKGYMFEVLIRKLLAQNGFVQIANSIPDRIQIHNANNIEIKGRGTWHQIDCPCMYEKSVPFIYDIRLLAEVKFYTTEIKKDKIRQYIGVVKDISENYFIDKFNTLANQRKFTDLGVFFAANGFQIEAEKLAFVHGIKTISYRNNRLVSNIKDNIISLERDYLKAENCISTGNLNMFMDLLARMLSHPETTNLLTEFEDTFNPESGFEPFLRELINSAKNIRTSFFGVTQTNYFIHFLSTREFPKDLFKETDTHKCKVFFEDTGYFYLTLNEDSSSERRFYFSSPSEVVTEALSTAKVLDEKRKHFNNISVAIVLDGIQRSLTLQIDETWLDRLPNE